MAFKMKATSGEDFGDKAPAGSHAAVLVAIIDLGSHTESYQGAKPKEVRKVYFAWELPTEFQAHSRMPYVLCREYTYSLNKKAGLRILIEKWRGASFKEGEEFDLGKMLGKPCLLTVVDKERSDGKKFSSIDGVTSLPKGMAAPEPTKELVSWEIDSGLPIPMQLWLPFTFGQSVQDKIKASKEWKSRRPVAVGGGGDADESGGEAPF